MIQKLKRENIFKRLFLGFSDVAYCNAKTRSWGTLSSKKMQTNNKYCFFGFFYHNGKDYTGIIILSLHVVNENLFFLSASLFISFPLCGHFSKNPNENRAQIAEYLFVMSWYNRKEVISICWWGPAAGVRLQKYGIWIKNEALVRRLSQRQVTAAFELLISVISPGKLFLPG